MEVLVVCLFCIKQKTAYEWRISDWSSDVCSSDLKMAQLWSQPEAKDEILTLIVNGDALGALGFSEPASGSDVFSARFSAVRDSDGWVMNGQKMFTTNGHNAEYILMLTRTDTSGKKHKGLTMFIMHLNLPGVEIHPFYTLQDGRIERKDVV